MNPIRIIRRLGGILAGMTAVLVACTAAGPAPAAFAIRVPPPGGYSGRQVPPVVHTVTVGGMPGWQIALIAAAAAVVAAMLAVLLDRAWAARRREIAGAA